MSIMILRGPEAASSLVRGPQALPRAVITQLVRCAGDAGKTVALRACGSEQELLDALRVAGQARMEIALIDPGSCVDSVRLHCMLAGLAYPYVEAHDDSADRPEPCLPAGLGQRVAIVRGYCAQSYLLGLEIALEHLGCTEIQGDVHVGT
ncbi:3-dehydroquinate dehydratase [Xanthomonas campestris]|uniref:3-dehydroquinate dehydratase n=1 Tax=Xanthomonas campestris TaxID=339 RepID=UPI0008A63ACF|nr:3-dehydroquinate dehydratase [Xanthomonas campestris]MEB1153051.1 3-dehydroquinate dehydratase [Xanthomonas campestris pv. campestris]MCC5099053.1 3-dehydroquinate dehydratase [Xanthomonas campestris]MEA9585169.1 3-dehydroquinate dehydratase [Xanthomonas campestris]MEA9593440.1 3-dehydroquinate dehydratase [Xanthomonas campestris]MEA9625051.1 3-dehydroquinate dehydratase [Xanthomonas campestris]